MIKRMMGHLLLVLVVLLPSGLVQAQGNLKVPSLRLQKMTGEFEVFTEDFDRPQRGWVLFFIKEDCRVCIRTLNTLSSRLKSVQDGWSSVLVIIEGNWYKYVSSVKGQARFEFEVLHDAGGRLFQQLGNPTLPSVYFVGRGGQVLRRGGRGMALSAGLSVEIDRFLKNQRKGGR
jgi:peroxiredoxin